MQYADLAFACVLSMLGGKEVTADCNSAFIHEVAHEIRAAADRHDVPADIIAAVIYHESRFKKDAIGSRGEVGLMQVMRGGAVPKRLAKLSNRGLMEVGVNVDVGTAYLARFRPRCSSPRWIAPYNGGRCRVSSYTTRVLADLRRGHAHSKEL